MGSPTDKDVRRVGEKLRLYYSRVISDRETFDRAYKDMMKDNLPQDSSSGKAFADKVFNFVVNKSGGRISGEYISKRARKGKEMVATRAEVQKIEGKPIRKYGKAVRVAKAERRAISYKFSGKQKGRVVYARKISVKTKYGKQIRYIDNRGRYVGLRK